MVIKQTLLILIIALASMNLNGQEMNEVNKKIIELFVATDNQEWDKVKKTFADKVILDYSSMNGNPAAELIPNQIISVWKGILPGFESTHHQLGNFISEIKENTAIVFCYGTATHFLSDEKGNIWTVVGSYDFDLIKIENNWKIKSMKFNFKYQDGNNSLPEKAIKKAKN